MINILANSIISNVVLSSKPCSRLLESDGISSKIFTLRGFDNRKLIGLKDVRSLKNSVPRLGIAINIVKNLDEYLFIVCNYVPNINDSNFFKIKFQKIRVLIHLLFNRLSKILSAAMDEDGLNEWIDESNSLLVETSDLVLEYRDSLKSEKSGESNENFEQKVKLNRDYFSYFDMKEESMDVALYSIYGIVV
ncbi:MAG TPA: hypothetical protein VER14_07690 [Phototrophicaceae bacterium]|nr:hypothetical protein [Phototrophicaceae bacterium]